ncbi:POT family proton-dependent oligopeptide transporter [Rhizomicrobium palustre]|uniref:POT family proton-dependent oligopeptide transporter n=1 Tax=Rhizomicrobium palustre TaxID=189966 RepID=A0A846N348_9PROT|nr:peptide MFS transporter [Rhizomicrobium palustre]NIK89939.1 POT family proton-dependent oligopeptide transporter [Rhizomicrobium palustre]
MTDTNAVNQAGAGQKLWFGHPRLLSLLFTTEMWERFGYYGMRAVLVLYLVEHFVFSDNVANGLYGAFASLVYLTPLIGGFVADQFIGPKRAVKTGAVLMSIGYMLLAFTGGDAAKPFVTIDSHRYEVATAKSGDGNTQYLVANGQRYKITGNEDKSISIEGATGDIPAKVENGHYKFDGERNSLNVVLLFLSLGLVIVGNGYFKPNITSILGQLYDRNDRRRDSAYSIFYMGINLGSIISQGLVPLIAIAWGYKWGFAFAGFGMILAWARFQFAGDRLAAYGNPPANARNINLWFYGGTLLAIPVVWFLLNNTMLTASIAHKVAATGVIGFLLTLPVLGQVMFFVFFAAIIGIPLWGFFTLKPEERDRMIVACVLTTYSVVFFTLFEQAGSSLTLFADRNTDLVILAPHQVLAQDLHFFGMTIPAVWSYTMPAGQVQIFNPLFIVGFAPLFTLMWNKLAKLGIEPTAPLKFAFGLALVGLGFLALIYGARFHGADYRVPLIWLVLAYWLHSMGELCLSPVGLSAVSKLSIPKLVGMMFGVWLMASAMAQYVGGIVAQLASTETVGGKALNPQVSLETYLSVFQTIGIAGIICGGIAVVLWPILKKGMHGIR